MSVEIVLVNNELYSIRIVLVGFAKSTHALRLEGLRLVRKRNCFVKKRLI